MRGGLINHHNHPNQYLREILLVNTVHVALGDFNIDFLTNDSNNLKQLMEAFSMHQLISQPTCIPGASLLDHVYVALPFFRIQNICVATKGVYYSDHEAIKVTVTNLRFPTSMLPLMGNNYIYRKQAPTIALKHILKSLPTKKQVSLSS